MATLELTLGELDTLLYAVVEDMQTTEIDTALGKAVFNDLVSLEHKISEAIKIAKK